MHESLQALQIEEEIAHAPKRPPKISTQQCAQHEQVEQIVEVPVPMMEEEVVHAPKIIAQTVEQAVEVPVPMMQEEVQLPKIITQTRVQHQHVEQTMGIPVPMTPVQQQEVEQTVIAQTRVQQHVEQIVEVPVSMIQDIVQSELLLVHMFESISVCLCWSCFSP